MLLRTLHTGLLAIGLIIAPAGLAQNRQTGSAPAASPQSSSCATTTRTSTYLTPHAAIDVKDTTFCFDPKAASFTWGSAYHLGADFSPDRPIALTATPDAASTFSSWNSAGNLLTAAWVVVDTSGSMSGFSGGPITLFATSEGTSAVTAFTLAINQATIRGATIPSRSLFVFSDLVGAPFFVPADPSVPVVAGDFDGDGISDLTIFPHADEIGAYTAVVSISGRRMRAITIRPRGTGFLAKGPPVHHHVSIRGTRGESATFDIDATDIRAPSLVAGPSGEPQCMVLARRIMSDGSLSVSGVVTEQARIPRPAYIAAFFPQPPFASGILPLRI